MGKAKGPKVVYDFHPYSEHFELLEGDDKSALVADLKANGLYDEITLFEDMVLDGRNRYLGCEEAGIEQRYVEFEGTQEQALALVKSRNIHRRHSTKEQRAFAAAKLSTLVQGQTQAKSSSAKLADDENQQNPATLAELPAKTQEQAAAEMNVSVRDLQRAKRIAEQGADEVQEAVKGGEVSLSAADKIASLPKKEQADALLKQSLHKDVVAAWESGELTRAQCKTLAGMRPMLQTDELKKIREKAGTGTPTQAIAGNRTPPNSKPPSNDWKGPAKKIHKIIGQLSRSIDDHARELQWQKAKVKEVHSAIDGVKKLVLGLEGR